MFSQIYSSFNKRLEEQRKVLYIDRYEMDNKSKDKGDNRLDDISGFKLPGFPNAAGLSVGGGLPAGLPAGFPGNLPLNSDGRLDPQLLFELVSKHYDTWLNAIGKQFEDDENFLPFPNEDLPTIRRDESQQPIFNYSLLEALEKASSEFARDLEVLRQSGAEVVSNLIIPRGSSEQVASDQALAAKAQAVAAQARSQAMAIQVQQQAQAQAQAIEAMAVQAQKGKKKPKRMFLLLQL